VGFSFCVPANVGLTVKHKHIWSVLVIVVCDGALFLHVLDE